jgi:ABC-type bacteriocin/lantibiotic exporter with double-glycine peptidase domain
MEWFLCGLFCTGWTSYRLGNRFSQSATCFRYFIPTVFIFIFWITWITLYVTLSENFYYDVNDMSDSDSWLFFLLIIPFVLFLFRLMMLIILRSLYLQRKRMNESFCRSIVMVIFCYPCAFGEMGTNGEIGVSCV